MALRDAVRSTEGAQLFAEALYEFLYGRGSAYRKFERWCNAVEALPRKQTRVLTWPLVTIFGFIAQPEAAHLPQAQRDADRGSTVRLRLFVHITAVVGNLRKLARIF